MSEFETNLKNMVDAYDVIDKRINTNPKRQIEELLGVRETKRSDLRGGFIRSCQTTFPEAVLFLESLK